MSFDQNALESLRIERNSEAAHSGSGGTYKWFVAAILLIAAVAVRTGGERDGQIEVLSGINAGEVVVAQPVDGLSNGVSVKTKQ